MTTNSTFRTKVATAKTFGMLGNQRGEAVLTELGRRIADPTTEAAARADAFMHVPLYRKLYEDYAGKLLPGDSGLEAEIERLGVPEKSSSRARQVFQRSAEQAGFFSHGRNRLTKPAAATVDSDHGDEVDDQDVQTDNGADTRRRRRLLRP